MRISDWSSDVCSSDLFLKSVHCILEALAGLALRLGRGLDRHRFTGARVAARRCFPLCNREGSEADQANFLAFLQSAPDGIKNTERKSVVWGKSVSVRVNLGGCRILKKKKLHHN